MAEIQQVVNEEMKTRVEAAAVTLKDIVQSPSAIIMEGKIAGLSRQGKIDDALMTLLEANIQQAEQAGEAGKGALQASGAPAPPGRVCKSRSCRTCSPQPTPARPPHVCTPLTAAYAPHVTACAPHMPARAAHARGA